MRILFFSSNSIWLNGLPLGFRDLGHEIKASGPLSKSNIPKIIKEFAPDLTFSVGWGLEQSKEKQNWIRDFTKAAGVPHIYWAVEDPFFTKIFTLPLVMRMEPEFVFTLSQELIAMYHNLGFKAAHLDFGFHPVVHRRVEKDEQYRSKIAVVANAYPDVLNDFSEHYRHKSIATLIRPLIKNNIRVDLWGRNWDKVDQFVGKEIPSSWRKGSVPYTEANKVYSSADIVIGLQNYTSQVTQRTYEILGSSGFLLTLDTPAVTKLFKPGHELVVSSSPEQTLDLINYYLQHEDERENIKKNGRSAVEKHSYKCRAEYVINVLKQEGVIK